MAGLLVVSTTVTIPVLNKIMHLLTVELGTQWLPVLHAVVFFSEFKGREILSMADLSSSRTTMDKFFAVAYSKVLQLDQITTE